MSVTRSWPGREEFRKALRELPDELRGEAGNLVEARANGAHVNIRAAYNAHRHTGNLSNHVKFEKEDSRFGVIAVIKNTARHAFIFENGTQIRKNKKGANRGAMPAGNVFIPAMVRARALLTEDLMDLLRRAGLLVRRV